MRESDNGLKSERAESLPRIPHPDRILYPDAGITRIEVVSYYAEVAPYLLRQAEDRALTVKRWPHGIHGPMFYQKHPPDGGPIVVEDTEHLLTWVGQGALEWHAPLGTLSDPLVHDWAILDLDPNPPAAWREVVEVAKVFKALLDLLDIPFLLKTSGQRGLHFYVSIKPLAHQLVMETMGRLAAMVVDTVPDLATMARLKRDRGARVYLDYLQNGYQRTTVMAYSLRATSGATVATPIRWGDVDRPVDEWTMARVREHLKQHGDLFRWDGPPVDLAALARRHGLLAH